MPGLPNNESAGQYAQQRNSSSGRPTTHAPTHPLLGDVAVGSGEASHRAQPPLHDVPNLLGGGVDGNATADTQVREFVLQKLPASVVSSGWRIPPMMEQTTKLWRDVREHIFREARELAASSLDCVESLARAEKENNEKRARKKWIRNQDSSFDTV